MASIFPTDGGGESNTAYEARGLGHKGNPFPQGRLAVLLIILAVSGWFLAGVMWSARSAPQASPPPVAGLREEGLPAAAPPAAAVAPAATAREENLSTPPPPGSGAPAPQLRENGARQASVSGVHEAKQGVIREDDPVTSATVLAGAAQSDTVTAVGSKGAPSVGALPYLGLRGTKHHKGNVKGLKIMEVFPGSPAARAGLRSGPDPSRTVGDLIIRVNDYLIASEDDLRDALYSCVPGDEVKFLVTESTGGRPARMITVTLGAAPQPFSVRGYTSGATAGVVTVAAARSESGGGESKSRGASISMTKTEQEIFDMVNEARAEHGLPALSSNPKLLRVARQYSKKMASEGFFSHTGPGGEDVVDRLNEAGVKRYRSVGENIFFSQNERNVPRTAVRGWLESPGHRKNMLSPDYTETGLGLATAAENKVYVTQVFLEP